VMIGSLSGINLDDLSTQSLQRTPQEMVDAGARTLMQQNDSLPLLRRVDTGQLGKRHCAVDW